MVQLSHKHVFVLDNTAKFRSISSNQHIEFDVGLKTKNGLPSGVIPFAPICKSLWTSIIEALQEYARIVYDLFLEGNRVLSFVTVNERVSSLLVDWSNENQNLNHINSCFARSSLSLFDHHGYSAFKETPNFGDDHLKSGLLTALEALSHTTSMQKTLKKKAKPFNRGRIILISNFQSQSRIKMLTDFLTEALTKMNATLREKFKDSSRLPVSECHLTIINAQPLDDNISCVIPDEPIKFVAPNISYDVHSTKGGTFIASKMLSLVQTHYGLASTTVSGIPMKEEQNASSSANYDVEIIHPLAAHSNLKKFFNRDTPTTQKMLREDGVYETVPLKWCTPRSTSVELHHCSNAFKISPVDVNSRPSSCLTNFLLSGRTVMLELTRSKGSKLMSHMLSSHNGALYIHTLQTGRSLLEEPPSISEGVGGRITDYRINEFGELMRRNKLIPCRNSANKSNGIQLIDLSVAFLKRQTLYWPIVIGHTLIFNVQSHIQSLLNLVPKESLTMDEVNECKSAIYQIVKIESRGNALVLPSIHGRGKGLKKEELYKMLWKELDYFIQIHASTLEHKAVLCCLRDIHSSQPTTSLITETKTSVVTKTEPGTPEPMEGQPEDTKDKVQLAWKELDTYCAMTEREKKDFNEGPTLQPPTKKAKIQNIESPTESDSKNQDFEMGAYKSGSSSSIASQTLLGMWSKTLNHNWQKRPEFKGRSFKIAPLYVHLNRPPQPVE